MNPYYFGAAIGFTLGLIFAIHYAEHAYRVGYHRAKNERKERDENA